MIYNIEAIFRKGDDCNEIGREKGQRSQTAKKQNGGTQ